MSRSCAIVAADKEGLKAARLRNHHLRGSSALNYESDVILILNEKYNIVAKVNIEFNPHQAQRFRDWTILSVEKNRAGRDAVDLEFEKHFEYSCFNPNGRQVQEKLIEERLYNDYGYASAVDARPAAAAQRHSMLVDHLRLAAAVSVTRLRNGLCRHVARCASRPRSSSLDVGDTLIRAHPSWAAVYRQGLLEFGIDLTEKDLERALLHETQAGSVVAQRGAVRADRGELVPRASSSSTAPFLLGSATATSTTTHSDASRTPSRVAQPGTSIPMSCRASTRCATPDCACA